MLKKKEILNEKVGKTKSYAELYVCDHVSQTVWQMAQKYLIVSLFLAILIQLLA